MARPARHYASPPFLLFFLVEEEAGGLIVRLCILFACLSVYLIAVANGRYVLYLGCLLLFYTRIVLEGYVCTVGIVKWGRDVILLAYM